MARSARDFASAEWGGSLFGGGALLVPAAPAAVHGNGVFVSHLLKCVGGESGSEAAAAVQDDLLLLVGHHALNVALDDALAEVDGANDMPLVPFVIFADVNKRGLFAGVHAFLDFGDVGFLD